MSPVVEPTRAFPDELAAQVVVLTEQALARGLDTALDELLPAMASALGARSITVDLPECPRAADPLVVVDHDDPDLAGTLARLLTVAVASAHRVVDARATATAQVDELRAIARVDGLTGALTRRAFLEVLDEALGHARREGGHLTVALCDLDGLKAINDEHGHPMGDAALQAFVRLLGNNLRGYDTVGRLGGDEFGIILPGAEAEAEAAILGRLRTRIERGTDGGAEVHASFGTARFPDDGTTPDDLLAAADRRLYERKRSVQSVRR